MEFVCKKCGGLKCFYQYRGFQVGLFCESCGSWQKWISKRDQNVLRARGVNFLSQDISVQISKDANLGVSLLNNDENLSNDANLGFLIEDSLNKEECRKTGEVNSKGKDKSVNECNVNEKDILSDTCPICNGDTLVPSNDESIVDLSIFDGILTVTDKAGLKILGMYKIKRCPYCGKSF